MHRVKGRLSCYDEGNVDTLEMEEKSMNEMKNKLNFISAEGHAPVVLYLSNQGMEFCAADLYEQAKRITGKGFGFCELAVDDWDRMLTPWPVADCMKGRHFTGEGEMLMEGIEKEIIPMINRRLPEHQQLYIAGYSLAGLFSLWTLYQSTAFNGAVCCSGSLWYPGWEIYMQQSFLQRNSEIYLSLGKQEPKTKHPLMKRIGEITEKQYQQLEQDKNAEQVVFEWQEGGHFSNVQERIALGIRWILA